MKAINFLNQSFKSEMKSFALVVKVFKSLQSKNDQTLIDFLVENDLTFEQLTDQAYVMRGMRTAEFTNKAGEKFTTICRKNKAGELEIAGWSGWSVMSAAAKVRRSEIKAAEKAAKDAEKAAKKIAEMKAKEESRKELDKEEAKKAEKKEKKAA